MCGIAGIIHSSQESAYRAVSAMNRAQAHRGPDDEGTWQDGWTTGGLDGAMTIGLGHTRLAIIDISSAGHQPMTDLKRGNWITYNGEIYNFKELRQELEEHGEVFRTGTDTEVILKAYAVWGETCVKRLRGIFAFGIWDSRNKRLLLARDPLGIKPLYVWQNADQLVFASEVRAILATGMISSTLDMEGLLSYLAYGSVQEPLTLVQQIRSLPAGHIMTWQNGVGRMERYWQLPPIEALEKYDSRDIQEEIRAALFDAVESQLISDVPLGAFLSGGIDSTAIAALMRHANRGPVRTFSLVFQEGVYDERNWSRLAAQRIGTEHTEVELTGEMVRQWLPQAMMAFDQPSADGLNTWFVSKTAREAGLTVALSGLGGDELFGGYDGYRKPLMAERAWPMTKGVPFWLRKSASGILNKLDRNETVRKAGELLVSDRHPYFLTRKLFSNWQMRQLLSEDVFQTTGWQELAFGQIESEAKNYDPINRASAFELQTYMRSTLLRDADQMSMAHALEVRVPLIDHKLVELLFTVQGRHKLDRRHPKPLLTRPLHDLLPQECVFRAKRGFELPFQVWLKDALQIQIRDSFCSSDVADAYPFSPNGLNKLWRNFLSGRVNWSRVWAVFVLREWLKRQGVR